MSKFDECAHKADVEKDSKNNIITLQAISGQEDTSDLEKKEIKHSLKEIRELLLGMEKPQKAGM